MPNTITSSMVNTKDIIIMLKEVREEKGLSYADIITLVEERGGSISKTTLSKIFSDGSEDMCFSYENTLRPIANALLDIETIEEDDNIDAQAMKSLLKYKIQRIEELENQIKELKAALNAEKVKYHEKLEKEREQSRRSIEFLKDQISLKDKRMDQLLEAVFVKDNQHKEMLNILLKYGFKDGN